MNVGVNELKNILDGVRDGSLYVEDAANKIVGNSNCSMDALDMQKDREAYNTWHFNNWKLTCAVTDSIEDAKELYDRVYSHDIQNRKREREFMVWQAAKASAVPDGYVLVHEHAEINLGNGLSTICDWCDFDSVNKYSWFLVKNGKVFYAATNIRETDEHGNSILKRRYLHRILFKDLPKGMVVDHLNGNGLDNRRSNLRIVSHQQNTRNRSGSQKNSKSGVRGVYWHKQRGKWAACIRHNGKNISLGLYDDLEEAKKSRLSKELEIWDADDTYQTRAMIEAAQEQDNEN